MMARNGHFSCASLRREFPSYSSSCSKTLPQPLASCSTYGGKRSQSVTGKVPSSALGATPTPSSNYSYEIQVKGKRARWRIQLPGDIQLVLGPWYEPEPGDGKGSALTAARGNAVDYLEWCARCSLPTTASES